MGNSADYSEINQVFTPDLKNNYAQKEVISFESHPINFFEFKNFDIYLYYSIYIYNHDLYIFIYTQKFV